jgi:DNA polymerase-3 subunit alpha (Gram-positive type)
MVNKMKQLGINNVQDINTKLQNKQLHHHQFGNFIEVYARNQEGIKDIYRLVSTSHTDNLHKRPRVYIEDLKSNRRNLIITNHPTESDIWDIAINGTDDQLALAMMFYDYIYVSPPKTLAHISNRGDITELNIKKTIQKIIDTANNINKKVIAVSDAYYLDP